MDKQYAVVHIAVQYLYVEEVIYQQSLDFR